MKEEGVRPTHLTKAFFEIIFQSKFVKKWYFGGFYDVPHVS